CGRDGRGPTLTLGADNPVESALVARPVAWRRRRFGLGGGCRVRQGAHRAIGLDRRAERLRCAVYRLDALYPERLREKSAQLVSSLLEKMRALRLPDPFWSIRRGNEIKRQVGEADEKGTPRQAEDETQRAVDRRQPGGAHRTRDDAGHDRQHDQA